MSGPSERIGRTPSSTTSSTISTARSTPKQNPYSSASKTSICPVWTSSAASILAILAADLTHGYGLTRKSVPGDGFHQVGEPIQLAEGGVNVGCYANSLEFFVDDRRRENAMFVEKITADRGRFNHCDIHICDRTRLVGIERRIETDFRHILETIHPVTRQVPEPCFLSFAAEAVVKQQCFTNREPGRCRVRADLFKFTNVVRLRCLRCHQRPQLLALVALHKKQSAAFRGVEPFGQTRAEVIAAEIFLFEVKLRIRVRAVNASLDSFRARHFTNRFHWSDLARDIHLM